MMKLFKLLMILIVLTLLAVTFTPLDFYYAKVSKNIRPITLEGISGSAIKGSAEKIKYLGMDLGQVNWLLYPSSYDSISLDVEIKDEHYDFIAEYKNTIDSKILKNLRGSADWKLIEKYINFNHGEISGYLSFDFKQLEMLNGAMHRIDGRITTKELKLLKPIKKDLGEIEVVFKPDNPQIMVGLVNSKSNVLNISGAIYIHKNHRWEIKLTLIPMPGEYEIEYALQGVGDKRRGGGRSLNIAGFY